MDNEDIYFTCSALSQYSMSAMINPVKSIVVVAVHFPSFIYTLVGLSLFLFGLVVRVKCSLFHLSLLYKSQYFPLLTLFMSRVRLSSLSSLFPPLRSTATSVVACVFSFNENESPDTPVFILYLYFKTKKKKKPPVLYDRIWYPFGLFCRFLGFVSSGPLSVSIELPLNELLIQKYE